MSIAWQAGELNRKCRWRDWDCDRPVIVQHHPRTAVDLWRCKPCEPFYRMERNRLAALARREARIQEKRDAYEKPMLTTFNALEVRVDPSIVCVCVFA